MDLLEQQAQEAIRAGADPIAVQSRLAQMREQMQPKSSPVESAMRGRPGMPASADEAFANHMKATAKNIGRNVINIPHNIDESIPAIANPDRNYFAEYGIKQSVPDEILQTAIEYAPFGGGAAKVVSKIPGMAKGFKNLLASSVLGNAAYGAAANKDDRLRGTEVGAIIGTVAPIAGKTVDKIAIEPAAKFIAQQSGKPLSKKAVEKLAKTATDPEDAAAGLKAAHDVAKSKSNTAWSDTNARAKELDEIQRALPNSKFNASPYNDVISQYEQMVGQMEPAKKIPYNRALDFLNDPTVGGKAIAPQSFEGAIANRQGINTALNEFLEKNQLSSNRELTGISEKLKNSLESVVDKNIPAFAKDKGELFKKSWADANASTQKVHEFYDAPQKLGSDKTHQQMKELFRSPNAKADGAIIDIFTPKTGQTGAPGLDKLSELVGKDKAQSYVKGYIMRGIGKGESLKSLEIYHKLSPQQRNAIFGNSKEGKLLESASRVWREIGKDSHRFFSHMPWVHGLATFGAPGVVAGGTALAMGEPWERALGIGAGVGAASLGAGKGLASLSGSFPGITKGATRLATEGRKNPGGLTAKTLQATMNKDKEKK